MTALRVAIAGLVVFLGVLMWRVGDVMPTWLQAFALTMCMVGLIAAAGVGRLAAPAELIDNTWPVPPPDPTVLAGHREALNPVPAVARPPVDALLAAVPASVPVEASVRPVEAPDEVIAPEADDDRLARLEDQLRRVAEDVTKIGAVVEEVAELSATGIAQLRRQVQALEVPR